MKNILKTAPGILLSIALCVAVAGCAQKERALQGLTSELRMLKTTVPAGVSEEADQSNVDGYASSESSAPAPPPAAKQSQPFERKIIVTGSMDLEVVSFETAAKEIEKIATAAGGYLGGMTSQSEGNGKKYGEITIRMPQKGFGGALKKIKALGTVRGENIKRDDVSEEYIDLQARLKNKRRVEETYQKILERATKISDILEVEAKIGEARGEIEQMEGRMKYLDNQVSLSTLTISLSEKGVYTAPAPDEWSFRDIVKRATHSFVSTVKSLAEILVWAAVYSPLIILFGLLLGALRRHRRKRKSLEK